LHQEIELEEKECIVLSSDFGWRMLGPKSGEMLASTYGLRCSLDGLPQILEFWRSRRIPELGQKEA